MNFRRHLFLPSTPESDSPSDASPKSNWDKFAHAKGLDWETLVYVSYEYMKTQYAQLESNYGLSTHERWDIDVKGELNFSNNDVPAVVAEIQLVGFFSNIEKTWVWSWSEENPFPDLPRMHMENIREYGRKENFEKLAEPEWKAKESDGSAMTIVANYLLKAEGVYRARSDDGVMFLVMTKLRKMN